MSQPLLGNVLLVLGVVLMLHVAFSTYEHLSILKALDRTDEQIPLDMIVESMVAVIVGIGGAALKTPDLKEITWASEMKSRSIDEFDSRLGFMTFNHRGSKLFGDAAMAH